MTITTKELTTTLTNTNDSIENLAFLYWQYSANEKAYTHKLITTKMYEFAKEELRKSIDQLSRIYYRVGNKVGDSNGFIKNTAAIGWR